MKKNDLNWSEAERDEIINNAVDIQIKEPVPKKKEQEEVIEDRVEEDTDFSIKDIYFESSYEE